MQPLHLLHRLEDLLDVEVPAGLCDVMETGADKENVEIARNQIVTMPEKPFEEMSMKDLDYELIESLDRESMKPYLMIGYLRFGITKPIAEGPVMQQLLQIAHVTLQGSIMSHIQEDKKGCECLYRW